MLVYSSIPVVSSSTMLLKEMNGKQDWITLSYLNFLAPRTVINVQTRTAGEASILIGNSYFIFISQLNATRFIDSKWRKVVEAEYFV